MKSNRPRSASTEPSCRPRFRIKIGDEIALGPGKIDLLEAIEKAGSISGAAKASGLSYRRAWDMVDTMNRLFSEPLVESITGGRGGGGARLSPLGEKVAKLYRDMETQAHQATTSQWKALKKTLRT